MDSSGYHEAWLVFFGASAGRKGGLGVVTTAAMICTEH